MLQFGSIASTCMLFPEWVLTAQITSANLLRVSGWRDVIVTVAAKGEFLQQWKNKLCVFKAICQSDLLMFIPDSRETGNSDFIVCLCFFDIGRKWESSWTRAVIYEECRNTPKIPCFVYVVTLTTHRKFFVPLFINIDFKCFYVCLFFKLLGGQCLSVH